MVRMLSKQARTIRLPIHMTETVSKLKRTVEELAAILNREPTTKEIAEAMNLPVERVRDILKIARPVSLETPIGEEGDSQLGDFIEDKSAPDVEEIAANMALEEQVGDVLKILTAEEQRILTLRFGLKDNWDRTVEEVAGLLGETDEHVRKVEEEALWKIRESGHANRLRDLY